MRDITLYCNDQIARSTRRKLEAIESAGARAIPMLERKRLLAIARYWDNEIKYYSAVLSGKELGPVA